MDIEYLLGLQGFREQTGGVLDGLLSGITELGGATVTILVAAILYWCVHKRTGQFILANFNWATLLNQALKNTFCVYRPWVRDARVQPLASAKPGATGYSFPSGHTANGGSLFGGLAVCCRKRRWASALFVLLWLLVAFSRNYAGVHTPQDCIVSFAIGLAMLWFISLVFKALERDANADRWVLLGTLLASAALLLYVSLKSYPMDYVDGELLVDPARMTTDAYSGVGNAIGFICGWFWERRRIRFTVEGHWLRRVVRGAVGALLTLAVYKLGGMALGFLGHQWSALGSGLLVQLTITALYPLLFQAVERACKRAPGGSVQA